MTQLKANNGWVELFSQPLFNEYGTQLAIIASQLQGEAGGFRHVTLISTEGAQQPLDLTKGQFIVTELYKWDTDYNRIFYAANLPGNSTSKHLFAIKAQSGAEPQCITCDLDGGKYL